MTLLNIKSIYVLFQLFKLVVDELIRLVVPAVELSDLSTDLL